MYKSLTLMSSPDLGNVWVTVWSNDKSRSYHNVTKASLGRLNKILDSPSGVTVLSCGTVGVSKRRL